MNAAELHVHIGSLRLDAAFAGGATPALSEAVCAAIALRLAGNGVSAAPPNALVDAIASAVQARLTAAWPEDLSALRFGPLSPRERAGERAADGHGAAWQPLTPTLSPEGRGGNSGAVVPWPEPTR